MKMNRTFELRENKPNFIPPKPRGLRSRFGEEGWRRRTNPISAQKRRFRIAILSIAEGPPPQKPPNLTFPDNLGNLHYLNTPKSPSKTTLLVWVNNTVISILNFCQFA